VDYLIALKYKGGKEVQHLTLEEILPLIKSDKFHPKVDRIWVNHENWAELPTEARSICIKVVLKADESTKNNFEHSCFPSAMEFCLNPHYRWWLETLEAQSEVNIVFNKENELLYANQAAKHWNINFPHALKLCDFDEIIKNHSAEELWEGQTINGKWNIGNEDGFEIELRSKVISSPDQKLLLLSISPNSQKILEKTFQKEKQKNDLILNQNFGAYAIVDAQTRIKEVSGDIFKMVGYTWEEVLGTESMSYVHPEDEAIKQASIDRTMRENGLSDTAIFRVRHKDGHYIWIENTYINHLQTPEIEGIVLIVKNIDAQEKARLELVDSNQRFLWASRATEDVIWDWDFKNNTIRWGENLAQIFGWSPEEIATTDEWMDRISAEDHSKIDESLAQAFDTKKDIWVCEYRFKKKDGNIAYILDRGYIQRNETGEAIRLIGAMHDYSQNFYYEQELTHERERFQQLFEHSLIGAAMLDLEEERWMDCNQSLLNILGFKRQEFLELRWKNLIPKAELKLNLDSLKTLKSGKNLNAYQTSWIRKDLATTRLVVSAFPTLNGGGRRVAWFHLLDLGPIEESNKALVEAESRFRQYVEKASDLFITLSDVGEFLYVAPNVKSLLHYSSTELLGKSIESFLHPEEQEKALKIFGAALKNPGENFRFVFRMLSKGGQWVWMEANGSIQAKGSQIKAFINLRDISKEHEAEAELRKLSWVANRTSNGVLIVDPDHKVEWINESYSKLSGYKLEEIKGLKMESFIHGPKSSPTDDAQINSSKKKTKPYRVENINYKKSGEEYWVESIVTPIHDNNGKLTNYISIETDITERKLEELDFQRNLQLISEQNERLRSFAHIVSHNFRSHGSNIHQLIRELNVTSDQILKNELHSFLEQSSQGLMQALDELSGLLEVESASELPTEELYIQQYCERVRQILSRPIMEINAELDFAVSPEDTIKFYPAYFESVLFNLVSNALRYHDPEKEPWVKVWLSEDEENKVLHVSDNGLGIDLDEHGEQLFKFKRSFHNHPESSGIGLYLVRSQIESLGGEIRVNSVVGKGTTFSVTVPK